jgi:hypothetical protein
MLFFSFGQGAARILSLHGLLRRHTVKTDGPVPPGYVLATTVLGSSQICVWRPFPAGKVLRCRPSTAAGFG